MRRVLEPGTSCGYLQRASDGGLLIDARDYYRAFFHAAKQAKHSLALAGWQFDSQVELLRGDDVAEAGGYDVRLLPFLNQLCERNPELHIYILAWDFSVIYAVEREWLQKLAFSWKAHERVHFHFDTVHAMGASHHQKLALIDGTLAFSGGMDIAASRWDDRKHAAGAPCRKEKSRSYGPYHDVQTFVRGDAARRLADIFEERWCSAARCEFKLPRGKRDIPLPVEPTLRLPPGDVAISQTRGLTLSPPQKAVTEIRELYLRAIDGAERLIYFENQYFTSRAVHDALVQRFRASGRSKLEVVLILPVQPEALKEQATLGAAQAKVLRSLKREAERTGHAFGVYSSVQKDAAGEELGTYIHSKLLIVDDTLLSVGSANTTNRSMGLDTELNLTWECRSWWGRAALRKAIERVRVGLLCEHAGVGEGEEAGREAFAKTRGLVATLNGLAERVEGRLRVHVPESLFDRNALLKSLEPESPLFDPELPIEAEVFEAIASGHETAFTRGIQLLSELFSPAKASAEADAHAEAGREDRAAAG